MTLLHCLAIFILPVSKRIFRRFEEPENAAECVFCLSEICEGDEVNDELRCKHVFHKCCLDKWVESRGRTCPLCRDHLSVGSLKKKADQAEVKVEAERFRRCRGETSIAFSAFGGLEDSWWIRHYS